MPSEQQIPTATLFQLCPPACSQGEPTGRLGRGRAGPDPLPWVQGEVITMGTVPTLHPGRESGHTTGPAGCMAAASLTPIPFQRLCSLCSRSGPFPSESCKGKVGWAPPQHPPLRVESSPCPTTAGYLDVFLKLHLVLKNSDNEIPNARICHKDSHFSHTYEKTHTHTHRCNYRDVLPTVIIS